MSRPTLRIGCSEYDTTRPLLDKSVGIDGFDAQWQAGSFALDIFRKILGGELDVSELGMTFYLRTLDLDDPPFVAVPVFPARVFRHSSIFVNTSSGIEQPSDLVGKTIGEFALYGQDSGVWAKGILSEEYGFRPERNEWVIGGLDRPLSPLDFIPQPHPVGLGIRRVPGGKTLNSMLESGEIDALFSANVPPCVLDGSPKVRRLFPDYESVERDYYRRTGIFPIMHTVVINKRRVADDPEVVHAVYRAFDQAKELAATRYRDARRTYQVASMPPWTNSLFERNASLFGDDWFPYGVKANRKAIDKFLDYHHQQGLSKRKLTIGGLFPEELLGT